ncbi:MAG: ABC transporter ATP-binding protein [Anaerolineales bacterium]
MSRIETQSLQKRFGEFTAVYNVTLTVEPGEILALLGPNGAGKTTTIRMLASILRPTSGCATVAGYDVVRQASEVRGAVGLLTEHHGLYTRMRAMEYLQFFGNIYGMSEAILKQRASSLLERYGLQEALQLRLGQYSKGMRQKLALVRALLHDPSVLLLDEPTSAMDPASAHLVREGIQEMRADERAIVVCTHNLHEAEALADRIAIISHGRIVAHDTPRRLKQLLMGDPVMELKLAVPLDGAREFLPSTIEFVDAGDTWMRYRSSDPNTANPLVLRRLLEAGVPVLTLSEIERSLEDVYLQIVGAEPPEVLPQ